MRTLAAALVAAFGLAAPAGGTTTLPFHATLKAYTHTPKVNARWPYEVHVTDLYGRPLAARVTVQLADPFGGVHPVEFDCCKKNIVAHPFKGVFREAVEYPAESRGFTLTFRVLVSALGHTAVLKYWVKPA